MYNIVAFIWLVCNISVLCAQNIHIQAKSITSKAVFEVAEIDYVDDGSAKLVSRSEESLPKGQFCIGSGDIVGMDCFGYIEVTEERSFNDSLALFIDGENRLSRIALSEDTKRPISIHRAKKAPSPNLKPVFRKKASSKPAQQVVKKVVKDENGNDVEIEEVEDNRSWVQKNWVYLVIPLLLVMFIPEGK